MTPLELEEKNYSETMNILYIRDKRRLGVYPINNKKDI